MRTFSWNLATALLGSALALGACGTDSDDGTDDLPDGAGGDLPAGVTAVPLKSFMSVIYTGPITIGGQLFDAVYDTGSSSIGIAGAGCTTCGVTPAYTPGMTA